MNSWLVPSLGFTFNFQDIDFLLKIKDGNFCKVSGSDISFGSTVTDTPVNTIFEFILIDPNGNFQKCLFVVVKVNSQFVESYLRFYDDSLSLSENLLSDWYICEFS